MIAIWDQRLSVGDPVIDSEHRQVIALLNEIDVALSVAAPAQVVDRALDALTRAIDRHFMPENPVEPAGPRVGEHAALAAGAHRLLQAWRTGHRDDVDRRALMTLASRWLSHIGRRERQGRRPAAEAPAISPHAASQQRLAG